MLRKIRIGVAWTVFLLATLLVLDFTGALHLWFGWLARVQLIPAILAASTVAIVAVVLLTLLFGRIYCSVLCPLGIMQDGISNLSGRRKGKKLRFRHSKPLHILRWSVFVLFVIAGIAWGAGWVVSLLDPWGAFGRIAENLFSPLWRWGNNFFAWIAERAGSYAFYPTDVLVKSWTTFAVALATLAILAILAWRKGRLYCNSVCPVGTILGELSRVSLFRPVIDSDKCTACGLCEKGCKSGCIDSKAGTVDRTRCVVCFDCIERCNFDGMKYRPALRRKAGSSFDAGVEPDGGESKGLSRRGFLSIAATLTVANSVRAQQLQVDGGLAEIEKKKRPDRKTPIVPPGAKGARHMQRHCTACQLCVSACPNDVLFPSSRLSTLMRPQMSYERGYCRPECAECSEVCPTGAIEKITAEDKAALSIGSAVWIGDNCVVNRDGVSCTQCQRHCPTGAVVLVARDPEDASSLKIPTVDTTLCIGCGACENLCPARPFPAIYIEGHIWHHDM